jgi:hypothetical protein
MIWINSLQYSGERGFYGSDIEQVVKEVCGCDVHSFFQSYVREGKEMDFNRYLFLIGRQARIKWSVAKDGHEEAIAHILPLAHIGARQNKLFKEWEKGRALDRIRFKR